MHGAINLCRKSQRAGGTAAQLQLRVTEEPQGWRETCSRPRLQTYMVSIQ